jgi:hypothetical protein
MFAVLRGGESSRWPPDRFIEWAVIGVVLVLLLTLFAACVSIRSWYRPDRPSTAPMPSNGTDAEPGEASIH